MNDVFSALKIGSVSLKNRLVVSPMCMYSAQNGYANNWHLVHLGSRAVGGAALVMAEATAVSADGRITPHDLGLYEDGHVDFLKIITEFIKQQGAVAGIQLAHAGRKASHNRPWEGNHFLQPEEGGWQTVAPSALPYKQNEPAPAALTPNEIDALIQQFKLAAQRALEAGFEVIEIHAAHGYLINQFLCSSSNLRTDQYGGSFENRIRLLQEIVVAVRQVWLPPKPLFVRISVTEWIENGWSLNDSIALVNELKNIGVDLIDCSSGGNSPHQKIPVAPLYQLEFASEIRRRCGILTGAVGLITTPEQAAEIIAEGSADLVFMGREFLRNPYFPLHAAHELSAGVSWPVQYERAQKK